MNEEEIKDIINDFMQLKEIHSSNSITKSFLTIYQEAIQGLLDLYKAEKEKNARLTKDNLDLDRLYRRTAEHLHNKGKDELADYMLAQIGAIPTWTCGDDYSNWVSKDKIKAKIEDKKREAERYIFGVDVEEGQAMYKILVELEQSLLEGE